MITNKDDYGYIAVFIDYLKQIIDMIVKLFNGMGKSDDDTAADDKVEGEVK